MLGAVYVSVSGLVSRSPEESSSPSVPKRLIVMSLAGFSAVATREIDLVAEFAKVNGCMGPH